jgi:hypothetical protein
LKEEEKSTGRRVDRVMRGKITLSNLEQRRIFLHREEG